MRRTAEEIGRRQQVAKACYPWASQALVKRIAARCSLEGSQLVLPPDLQQAIESAHRRHRDKEWRHSYLLDDLRSRLDLCSSDQRLSRFASLYPSIRNRRLEAELFAEALSSGDATSHERDFVLSVLSDLFAAGLRVAETGSRIHVGARAEAFFGRLPPRLTVFRGMCLEEADSDLYGTSWTLDRGVAHWFAARHGRFRRRDSAPAVASGTIPRDRVCVYLNGRSEREVVLDPNLVADLAVEPADLAIADSYAARRSAADAAARTAAT